MEKATRQQLFDEYTGRVFAARADIATAIVNIASLNDQIEAARIFAAVLENLVRTYQQAAKLRGDSCSEPVHGTGVLLQKRIAVAKLTASTIESVALEIAAGRSLSRGAATRPAPSTTPSTEGRQ